MQLLAPPAQRLKLKSNTGFTNSRFIMTRGSRHGVHNAGFTTRGSQHGVHNTGFPIRSLQHAFTNTRFIMTRGSPHGVHKHGVHYKKGLKTRKSCTNSRFITTRGSQYGVYNTWYTTRGSQHGDHNTGFTTRGSPHGVHHNTGFITRGSQHEVHKHRVHNAVAVAQKKNRKREKIGPGQACSSWNDVFTGSACLPRDKNGNKKTMCRWILFAQHHPQEYEMLCKVELQLNRKQYTDSLLILDRRAMSH